MPPDPWESFPDDAPAAPAAPPAPAPAPDGEVGASASATMPTPVTEVSVGAMPKASMLDTFPDGRAPAVDPVAAYEQLHRDMLPRLRAAGALRATKGNASVPDEEFEAEQVTASKGMMQSGLELSAWLAIPPSRRRQIVERYAKSIPPEEGRVDPGANAKFLLDYWERNGPPTVEALAKAYRGEALSEKERKTLRENLAAQESLGWKAFFTYDWKNAAENAGAEDLAKEIDARGGKAAQRWTLGAEALGSPLKGVTGGYVDPAAIGRKAGEWLGEHVVGPVMDFATGESTGRMTADSVPAPWTGPEALAMMPPDERMLWTAAISGGHLTGALVPISRISAGVNYALRTGASAIKAGELGARGLAWSTRIGSAISLGIYNSLSLPEGEEGESYGQRIVNSWTTAKGLQGRGLAGAEGVAFGILAPPAASAVRKMLAESPPGMREALAEMVAWQITGIAVSSGRATLESGQLEIKGITLEELTVNGVLGAIMGYHGGKKLARPTETFERAKNPVTGKMENRLEISGGAGRNFLAEEAANAGRIKLDAKGNPVLDAKGYAQVDPFKNVGEYKDWRYRQEASILGRRGELPRAERIAQDAGMPPGVGWMEAGQRSGSVAEYRRDMVRRYGNGIDVETGKPYEPKTWEDLTAQITTATEAAGGTKEDAAAALSMWRRTVGSWSVALGRPEPEVLGRFIKEIRAGEIDPSPIPRTETAADRALFEAWRAGPEGPPEGTDEAAALDAFAARRRASEARGMTQYLDTEGTTRSAIVFSRSADPSTVVHELTHAFTFALPVSELGALARDAGVRGDYRRPESWSTQGLERVAQGVERFVFEGAWPADINQLPAYAKLYDAMRKVYSGAPGAALSLEARNAFERAFGTTSAGELGAPLTAADSAAAASGLTTLYQREVVDKATGEKRAIPSFREWVEKNVNVAALRRRANDSPSGVSPKETALRKFDQLFKNQFGLREDEVEGQKAYRVKVGDRPAVSVLDLRADAFKPGDRVRLYGKGNKAILDYVVPERPGSGFDAKGIPTGQLSNTAVLRPNLGKDPRSLTEELLREVRARRTELTEGGKASILVRDLFPEGSTFRRVFKEILDNEIKFDLGTFEESGSYAFYKFNERGVHVDAEWGSRLSALPTVIHELVHRQQELAGRLNRNNIRYHAPALNLQPHPYHGSTHERSAWRTAGMPTRLYAREHLPADHPLRGGETRGDIGKMTLDEFIEHSIRRRDFRLDKRPGTLMEPGTVMMSGPVLNAWYATIADRIHARGSELVAADFARYTKQRVLSAAIAPPLTRYAAELEALAELQAASPQIAKDFTWLSKLLPQQLKNPEAVLRERILVAKKKVAAEVREWDEANADAVGGQMRLFQGERGEPGDVVMRPPGEALKLPERQLYQLTPEYQEKLRKAIASDPTGKMTEHARKALDIQDALDKDPRFWKYNKDKKWLEGNGDYGKSVDPDLLCQKSVGTDVALDRLKKTIRAAGFEYIPAMGWELLSRSGAAGLAIPCDECYVVSNRTAEGRYKQVILGVGGYAGEVMRFAKDTAARYQKGRGALRHNSSTDAKPEHVPGLVMSFLDFAARKMAVGGYTKEIHNARMFGPAGAYWNISVGNLGGNTAPMEQARKARADFRTISISKLIHNDAEILEGFTNPDVDRMIPYHSSSQPLPEIRARNPGVEIKDYTKEQHDRIPNENYGKVKGAPKLINNPEGDVTDAEHRGDYATYMRLVKERGLIPRFDRFHDQLVAAGTPELFMKLIGKEYGKFGDTAPYSPPDPSKIDYSQVEPWMQRRLKQLDQGLQPYEDIADQIAAEVKAGTFVHATVETVIRRGPKALAAKPGERSMADIQPGQEFVPPAIAERNAREAAKKAAGEGPRTLEQGAAPAFPDMKGARWGLSYEETTAKLAEVNKEIGLLAEQLNAFDRANKTGVPRPPSEKWAELGRKSDSLWEDQLEMEQAGVKWGVVRGDGESAPDAPLRGPGSLPRLLEQGPRGAGSKAREAYEALDADLDPAADWSGRRIGVDRVLEALEAAAGRKFLSGRAGRGGPGKAVGATEIGAGAVRLKHAGSLLGAVHTVGWSRFPDVVREAKASGTWGPVAARLVELGRELYPDGAPQGGWARAGMGVLVERLARGTTVPADAPPREALSRAIGGDPAGRARFEAGLAAFQDYVKQGAEARYDENMVDTARPSRTVRLRRWLRRDATREWFDDKIDIYRFSQEGEAILGRDLEGFDSPELVSRAFTGLSAGRASDAYQHGIPDPRYPFNYEARTSPGITDEVMPLLRKHGRREGPRKFGVYLHARRAQERWNAKGEEVGLLTDAQVTQLNASPTPAAAQATLQKWFGPGDYTTRDRGGETVVFHRGKDPGMSPAEADYLAKALGNPEFELAASHIYKAGRALLRYRAAMGTLTTEEVRAAIAESGSYVPLRRVMDDVSPGMLAAELRAGGDPFRKMGGSWRRVRNPLITLAEYYSQSFQEIERRVLANSMFKLARQVPELSAWMHEVPPEQAREAFNMGKIRSQLEKLGVDTTGVPDHEALTLWTTNTKANPEQSIFPVVTPEGKRTLVYIEPGLYQALTGHGTHVDHGAVWNIAKGLTSFFKTMTTGIRPKFAFWTNPARDLRAFEVQDQRLAGESKVAAPVKRFGSYMVTMFSALRELMPLVPTGEWHKIARHMGLDASVVLGEDRPETRRFVRNQYPRADLSHPMQAVADRVLRNPADALDWVREKLQSTEIAPRAASMRRYLLGEGVRDPKTLQGPAGWATALEAIRRFREVTVDFLKSGSTMREWNQIIPFFNVKVQGPRSTVRAFQKDPGGVVVAALMTATIPSLINWWRNKDEDWWKRMPWAEKFLGDYVPMGKPDENGNRELVGFPFTQEVSTLASIPLLMGLEYAYRKDPRAFKAGLGQVLDGWDPSGVAAATWDATGGFGMDEPDPIGAIGRLPIPHPARPLMEGIFNRKSYPSGRPIDSQGELGMDARHAISEHTTKLAIFIGDKLNLSPKRIDHVLGAVIGSVGRDLLQASPLGGPRAADQEPEPIPLGIGYPGGTGGVRDQLTEDLFALNQQLGRKLNNPDAPGEGDPLRDEILAKRLILTVAQEEVASLAEKLKPGVTYSRKERNAVRAEQRAVVARAMADVESAALWVEEWKKTRSDRKKIEALEGGGRGR